jgi:PAS domain S-box-containing protein
MGVYMDNNGNKYSKKFDDLRNKAEEILTEKKGHPKKLALEIDELIHELQVYQIELEVQNEELRTAQFKLKTSQIRYFEFYDLAPIGYYTLDTNGLILDVNLTGATFLGEGKHELINRPLTRFITPDSRKKFSKHVKRIIDSETNQQCELEIIKNESPIYVHIESKAFFDESGNIKEILITAIDITESKNAENERLESEEFLRNIVENIPNMIFIKSADNLNFEMVNKAGEELMGHSREELIGKTDYDFFPKDQADFFTQKDREALQNKKLLDIPEETIENKKLGQIILHTKKIPIFNQEGNPQYILGISEDITESKKAGKLLINSEKRYRTLYSSMTEGLAFHKLIYDDTKVPVDYEIVDVNNAYEEILGISRKEILGKKASEVYGTGKAPYLEIYYEVAQKGNPTDFETYFEPMNKHFSISVFSPSIGTFATIFKDITERKKGEKQLKKSLAEKEVLLREIHHRVKNNLQIIVSLLHLQENTVDKEVGDILKESEGRVKSMAIVHEKLYQSPNFTDIDFKQYIEKLVYEILYTYGIKIGTIEVQLDIEDININIDTAIPLGLIINELITNSVKYAFPQKEGNLAIKLKSLPEQMELTIADDGIGIPKDFDLKNSETLGLQLVNNLVNQLDGELKLNRDEGAEFKIIFKELTYKKRT